MLVNVHEHLQSRREAPLLLRSMDLCGFDKTVLLGSSAFTITSDYRRGFTFYEENNCEIIKSAREFPDRFEAWPTLNPLDKNNVTKLSAYHDQGASGLKLYLGHGYIAPGSSNYLFGPIAMDDPRMDEIYSYCAVNRLPVCLHVNPGPRTLGFADEFISVLNKHPSLLVNAPHWILSCGKSSRLAELLDVFPNLYTDVSFGVDQFLKEGLKRISRNVSKIRKVVQRFHGRFMFGTDFVVTSASHKSAQWMKTRLDAYASMLSYSQYETSLLPGEKLNGLGLSDEVRAGIWADNYYLFRNSKRITKGLRAVDWTQFGFSPPPRGPGERICPLGRSVLG